MSLERPQLPKDRSTEIPKKRLVIERHEREAFFIEPGTRQEIEVRVLQIQRKRATCLFYSSEPNIILRGELGFPRDNTLRSGRLILTRKANQIVIINPQSENPIDVKVLDVQRGRVKFGIADPIKRVLLREELIERPPRPTAPAA
ncbi:hypothetical protein A3A49_00035 [Candidatus Curtissbacteria bacterium RIFCSPLOWO2_01_FULL_38_11b]|uniref:Uncharacterized protein n=1 Tax=Candidatus Curtissbacteria bacterium RIFCSPLOWO2_01_FULL_38_11b TaxID=1797725 RepID=A0A1F5H223_9BACT|nr:MAG: hypothetical protein A3A49_00035 [Candidatus Curtissbacteria bacterium RIFCSPLOWO2_01_FULL_38_11b]